MKINIFQWRYSPFLILLPLLLPTGNAQAALSVTCQAGMNTAPGSAGIVNFGTITSTNANNASTTGTLTYSCTNTGDTAGYVSVCLAADGGEYNNTAVNGRYMQRPGSGTDPERRLNFTMTLPGGTVWSTRGKSGLEFNSGLLSIGANSTVKGSEVISLSMNGGNTRATQGVYTNNFGNGNHTALTFRASENSSGLNCATGNQGLDRFPFTVQAAIEPSCIITATSDVNLGPRSASETNITGSNSSAITVNCTNGGSYYVGLKPSNNSTTGAGVMSGTGGNLDKVPYQLRSTAGINGTIWGNTATSTTIGNGVADFGTGANKTHEVFVTVPSADFKPDNYSDTVTINVNY
ncbi:spore coat protein U-like protein [Psychrobacter luti]|uniref:Spore coat protein U-like protein n=1 Tax=Psychrobacter luti TaxID=198481 RepID=A0A839TDP4_9GAMM|nr:spore coat protein U domain-containing protein [Psychrobacter luti]MBB3107561.1 spore coat protein U-like protein [Psychrobacter luti]